MSALRSSASLQSVTNLLFICSQVSVRGLSFEFHTTRLYIFFCRIQWLRKQICFDAIWQAFLPTGDYSYQRCSISFHNFEVQRFSKKLTKNNHTSWSSIMSLCSVTRRDCSINLFGGFWFWLRISFQVATLLTVQISTLHWLGICHITVSYTRIMVWCFGSVLLLSSRNIMQSKMCSRINWSSHTWFIR